MSLKSKNLIAQPASIVLMENPAVASSSSSTASAKQEEFVSACRQGDLAKVNRLISEARAHSTETLREMVDSGDQTGWTPLLLACSDGRDAVVERLLAAGAIISIPTNGGATPLFVACQNGHLKVVERLLAAGANIDAPNKNGLMPLHVSCQGGYLAVVERLLAAGAKIDAQTNGGWTPLFMACRQGHQEVVERLLAAGVNIDTPCDYGATPLLKASQHGHHEVVERLLAAGDNIETSWKDGVTPLIMACANGHQAVVELLLSAGANINALFGTQRPIDLARQQNHPAIVSMLSQPLPAATVAAHQQRIRELKAQQEEAKANYLQDKQRSQLELAAAKTKAEQKSSTLKRLLLQKEADLAEAREREAQLRVEQERMNDVTRKAELSNFNVEQSQLDVDVVPFAKGGNGSIHRGRYHGTAVAIKYLSEGVPELYKKEVRMWCRLRHPNVLQLLGLSLDASRPMIVMELMERSLFDDLHDPTVVLEWRRKVEMAHGIAAGISYIHAQFAVHRDIKSLNVLVRGREVKIADFGSTRGQESLKHTKSEAGTLSWLAPELFSNAPSTSKVDVYAFGVVMFELATRETPWSGCTPASVVASVLAGERPQIKMELFKEAAGSDFVELMQRCWKQNAEDRPTSAEVSKELTSILGVPLEPFSSSSSPSTPNYANYSGFSLPGSSTPVAGPSSPLPACSSTDWSVEEWLTSIGLSQYIPTFRQNKILTPALIKGLDLTELKVELEIVPLGDRKLIIVEAARLL